MTSKGMMDPRYTRAVKSTENVFTPRELQMMDINPKNLMKAECTPYFEDNYTDKIKLKNTVIKNADAGLYEFFAKCCPAFCWLRLLNSVLFSSDLGLLSTAEGCGEI